MARLNKASVWWQSLLKLPDANEGGKAQRRVYVPVKQATGRVKEIQAAIHP